MDFDFLGEINPISIGAGILGGVFVFAMMGYAGVSIGIIWRILGFVAGAIGGFLVFQTIMSRG